MGPQPGRTPHLDPQRRRPRPARTPRRSPRDDPTVRGGPVRRRGAPQHRGRGTRLHRGLAHPRGHPADREAGLPFDACVSQHRLPELAQLAVTCPHTTIVLDHLGKPKPAARSQWSQAWRRLAQQPNVVCKLSGLATPLAPDIPSAFALSLLREALDVCGPDRCLFGSDWPVMLLATDYRAWLDLVREALGLSSWTANDAVLRGNPERIYRLVPSRFQAAYLARKEAR
ncbi:amidohydrolase family protein [Streptomyces sp. NPDC004232]|uniref:amidohydrolase family protein n=1 Tax=Streptomyces sp. NPDC004232 TaxID=3154454 RepID=UPI001D8AD987|nr:amidohydrolase family protein [Streptomyces sp. tea 10]